MKYFCAMKNTTSEGVSASTVIARIWFQLNASVASMDSFSANQAKLHKAFEESLGANPLAKLAQKFDPPVSKAGLSHRMKKIQEAAARLDAAPEPTEKEATNA